MVKYGFSGRTDLNLNFYNLNQVYISGRALRKVIFKFNKHYNVSVYIDMYIYMYIYVNQKLKRTFLDSNRKILDVRKYIKTPFYLYKQNEIRSLLILN